ncbi:hypothetical protein VaNZ11_008820 [Volvox africanus]|uniref:ATP-dependent RNA helicase n=1 Tax=Volvox africanus TaxID=51714 RepID=A0ABQ5S7P0_9CHLO|nr:hypothetical protein VaNZ11_008820 [Volvox africanus]
MAPPQLEVTGNVKGIHSLRTCEAPAGAGPVLPWMRVPLTSESGKGVPVRKVLGLDVRLASGLQNAFGFQELFPVQAAVWQHSAGGLSSAHDLCVSAPTGSGKTLAYALPVVNALAEQLTGPVGLLRALVVVPTRDLAAQVYDVFRPLCDAVKVRLALVAARTSEAAEAAELTGRPARGSATGGGLTSTAAAAGACRGADVVVATPGRLMAHLSGTPGFSLEHLRFLVVDETDRLLRQRYQDWLPRILARIQPTANLHLYHQHLFEQQGGVRPRRSAPGGPSCDHFAASWPVGAPGSVLPFAQPRVMKIVVSATLTRDPAKLQRLALNNPRFVATTTAAGGAAAAAGSGGISGRYSLPRSLSEYRLLCSAARKPLVLMALLREWAGQSTIIFTSSLDMTHKLFLMLRAVPDMPDAVVEYSSAVPVRERNAGLERFRSGGAKVLVASDAMARGMDVDCVQNVINYDVPIYAKTYVHRAGRTARAGKTGRVITLLRDEDMRYFKAMLRKADNNYLREYKLQPERVEALRPALAGALQQLEELLAAEQARDVDTQQQQEQRAKRPKTTDKDELTTAANRVQ